MRSFQASARFWSRVIIWGAALPTERALQRQLKTPIGDKD